MRPGRRRRRQEQRQPKNQRQNVRRSSFPRKPTLNFDKIQRDSTHAHILNSTQ